MLGDGHLEKSQDYKIGTYEIRIVGDSRHDKEYLTIYVNNLIKSLFGIKTRYFKYKKQNAICLVAHGKRLVEFIENKGLKPGNKTKSQVTIPNWIKENKQFLKSCLRGLVDTDGSVHRMSKKDSKIIRISFTNYNKNLLKDTRGAFVELGFHPSNIIIQKRCFLSRKEEIRKYLKEIDFSNSKHRKRLKKFSLVV